MTKEDYSLVRQAFLKDKVNAGLRKNPRSYCQELQRMTPSGFLKPGSKVTAFSRYHLGGIQYHVCNNDYTCSNVIARRSDHNSKLWFVDPRFVGLMLTAEEEFEMQNQVAKLGLAQPIEKMYIPQKGNKLAFALMEDIEMPLRYYLQEPKSKAALKDVVTLILSLLKALYTNNIVHGMFTVYNLSLVWDENEEKAKLQLNDFGRTTKKDEVFMHKFKELDIVTFIMSLEKEEIIHIDNRKYLSRSLKKFFKQFFNSRVKIFELYVEYVDTFRPVPFTNFGIYYLAYGI